MTKLCLLIELLKIRVFHKINIPYRRCGNSQNRLPTSYTPRDNINTYSRYGIAFSDFINVGTIFLPPDGPRRFSMQFPLAIFTFQYGKTRRDTPIQPATRRVVNKTNFRKTSCVALRGLVDSAQTRMV